MMLKYCNTLYAGGPARQFGSGAAGPGPLAVRVGRTALPLLKKYALPLVKKFGRNLVQAVITELKDAISGRKTEERSKIFRAQVHCKNYSERSGLNSGHHKGRRAVGSGRPAHGRSCG